MHDATPLPGMIGRHPAMLEVYRLTRLAARSDLPVLIVGETGTGKELVARALHDLCAAAQGPFIDINCAALPETLVEAELFGSERGAFTGATHPKPGFLELADRGTLFLDEACSLAPVVQAKLLRAIESGQFWRVGATERRRSRFRLVTAVARPVQELLARGTWRPDFAHRVATLTITVPPLRSRRNDVASLARHFLATGNGNGDHAKSLSPEAVRLLARHDWPGNVRELKAMLDRVRLQVADPLIEPSALVAVDPQFDQNEARDPARFFEVLSSAGWDMARAARALGVSRTTLWRRLKASVS